jgi:hypothetical protein
VYGDHYGDPPAHAFRFRLALPPPGSTESFALRWADHVQVGRPTGERTDP